jgi:hypothetical protein
MRSPIAAASVAWIMFTASAASAGTPNIAGVWHVAGRIEYGVRFVVATPTCTFRQAAGKLSGECVGPNARGPLTGIIAGDNVSWTWRHIGTTAAGITGDTNFNGTWINHDLIEGRMTSPAVPGDGPFTQSR